MAYRQPDVKVRLPRKRRPGRKEQNTGIVADNPPFIPGDPQGVVLGLGEETGADEDFALSDDDPTTLLDIES